MKKILSIGLLLVLCLGALVLFVESLVARKVIAQLEQKFSELFAKNLSIESASISFLSPRKNFYQVKLSEDGKPLGTIDHLRLISNGRIQISELTLDLDQDLLQELRQWLKTPRFPWTIIELDHVHLSFESWSLILKQCMLKKLKMGFDEQVLSFQGQGQWQDPLAGRLAFMSMVYFAEERSTWATLTTTGMPLKPLEAYLPLSKLFDIQGGQIDVRMHWNMNDLQMLCTVDLEAERMQLKEKRVTVGGRKLLRYLKESEGHLPLSFEIKGQHLSEGFDFAKLFAKNLKKALVRRVVAKDFAEFELLNESDMPESLPKETVIPSELNPQAL